MVSIVAAVLLFLMPWLDIRCSGTEMASQSGVQAAVGDASLSDRFERMREEDADSTGNDVPQDDKESLDVAPGALAGGLWLLVALAFSINALPGRRDSRRQAVIFATLALLAVAGQAAWGFPMENRIDEFYEEMTEMEMEEENPFAKSMAAAMAIIECRYTPWFYADLLFMAVPLLLYFLLGASSRPVHWGATEETLREEAFLVERKP